MISFALDTDFGLAFIISRANGFNCILIEVHFLFISIWWRPKRDSTEKVISFENYWK